MNKQFPSTVKLGPDLKIILIRSVPKSSLPMHIRSIDTIVKIKYFQYQDQTFFLTM